MRQHDPWHRSVEDRTRINTSGNLLPKTAQWNVQKDGSCTLHIEAGFEMRYDSTGKVKRNYDREDKDNSTPAATHSAVHYEVD
jgi:hypothetical protein